MRHTGAASWSSSKCLTALAQASPVTPPASVSSSARSDSVSTSRASMGSPCSLRGFYTDDAAASPCVTPAGCDERHLCPRAGGTRVPALPGTGHDTRPRPCPAAGPALAPAPGQADGVPAATGPPVPTPRRAASACRDRPGVRPLAGADAQRDDACGLDPDDGVLEAVTEGFAPRREHDCGATYLDHAGLPGREDVVDHDAGPPGALRVAELLGLAHPQATHVDRVVLGVVAERGGYHVWLPVWADRRDPAQPLAGEVVEFGISEHAHVPANPPARTGIPGRVSRRGLRPAGRAARPAGRAIRWR